MTDTQTITCLVPSHNEASSIARTIETLLDQTVPFTQVIIIPNGCSDNTADIARQYPVTVMELPKLAHRKCEALNLAYNKYCQDVDLVVTVDADTELTPTAVADWIDEFNNPMIAGSQAKFTMISKTLLARLQRAEYALGIDRALKKKTTSILAGAASCYRNRHLKLVVEKDGRAGPWSYESAVEDFELTLQLRMLGYRTIVSPTIRAYTDSMKNMKQLKAQRLKWQTGTIEDIIRIGFNKYTRNSWLQQIFGLFMVLITVTWLSLFILFTIQGRQVFALNSWWMLIPLVSALVNIKNANRIPNRDWFDIIIGGTLIVGEVYGMIRLTWMVHAWVEVLWSKITNTRKDRWEMQGQAEGIYNVNPIDTLVAKAVD